MTAEHRSCDAAATLEHLSAVSALLADGAEDAALYAAVEGALRTLSGFRLMTVLRATPCGRGLERMHSSDPAIYPARGIKTVDGDAWLTHLLRCTSPALSPDADAVRRNFFDADAIFGLGCQSVLNAPIRFQGRNMGTLNLLHAADWYQPADLGACQLFANLIGTAWASQQAAGVPVSDRPQPFQESP